MYYDIKLTYLKYSHQILHYINGFINDYDTSNDILQEIFLKIYEKGYNLDPESNYTKNFLYKCAKNKVIDYLRCPNNLIIIDIEDLEYLACSKEYLNTLENEYIEGEIVSSIYDIINDLDDLTKNIFIKHTIERVNIQEIQQEYKISKYKIYQEIKKAKNEILQRFKNLNNKRKIN